MDLFIYTNYKMEFIAKQLEKKSRKNKILKKKVQDLEIDVRDLTFELSMERKQVKHLESQVKSGDETIEILRKRLDSQGLAMSKLQSDYANVDRQNTARAEMIQLCLENQLDSRDKLSELMQILNDVNWNSDGDNLKAMNLMRDLYELTQ